MKRRKIVIFLLIVILLIVSLLMLLTSTNGKSDAPRAGSTPSKEVIRMIENYLQARENNIGADQSSPSAWLKIVKPLVTASFFSQLQPSNNSETSTESNEYIIAHNSNYVVKTNVSGCVWEGEILKPTKTSGAVTCNLVDTTTDRTTGSIIANSSLEFGWSRNGSQPPSTLGLIKQGSNWLINEDATGIQQ